MAFATQYLVLERGVRLGYLPPLAYCDFPNHAGVTLTDERQRVLAACQETVRVEARRAARVGQHLAELESTLIACRAA